MKSLVYVFSLDHCVFVQVVVNALIGAIPSIAHVFLVCMVFWLIFCIMGVQFFMGKFYKCLDETGQRVPETIVQNSTQCLQMARDMNMSYVWRNSDINFDNVFNAYLALFQVATYKGWTEIMADAVDSREQVHLSFCVKINKILVYRANYSVLHSSFLKIQTVF